jgi:hypothetical protein
MAIIRDIRRGSANRESSGIAHQKISASSFYIERGLLGYLEEYANSVGCTKHEAMRQALMEFMEKNPLGTGESTEKFLEYEIKIEDWLKSINADNSDIKWKVNLLTESSRIIYHYGLSKCPFCGSPSPVIDLIEDLGARKVHATMLGSHSAGEKCQTMLDDVLFG